MQLLVDVLQRQEADLWGMLSVPFDLGSRIDLAGGEYTSLTHGPVEKADHDLAVAVRRLGGQSTPADLGTDELADLGGCDLLEARGVDHRRLVALVGFHGLAVDNHGLLAGFRAQAAGGAFQAVTAQPEHLAEVVDVGLGALSGLDGADMAHVAIKHHRDGGTYMLEKAACCLKRTEGFVTHLGRGLERRDLTRIPERRQQSGTGHPACDFRGNGQIDLPEGVDVDGDVQPTQ